MDKAAFVRHNGFEVCLFWKTTADMWDSIGEAMKKTGDEGTLVSGGEDDSIGEVMKKTGDEGALANGGEG